MYFTPFTPLKKDCTAFDFYYVNHKFVVVSIEKDPNQTMILLYHDSKKKQGKQLMLGPL